MVPSSDDVLLSFCTLLETLFSPLLFFKRALPPGDSWTFISPFRKHLWNCAKCNIYCSFLCSARPSPQHHHHIDNHLPTLEQPAYPLRSCYRPGNKRTTSVEGDAFAPQASFVIHYVHSGSFILKGIQIQSGTPCLCGRGLRK